VVRAQVDSNQAVVEARRTSSETRMHMGTLGHLEGLQCKLCFKACLTCLLNPKTLGKFLNSTESLFPPL
jgi:hypothetical protein